MMQKINKFILILGIVAVSVDVCGAPHPGIILTKPIEASIRHQAKSDSLLKRILDEVFMMAEAELSRPIINYDVLKDRPHRTSKEALADKYVMDIASLTGARMVLLSTAFRFADDANARNRYFQRIKKEIDAAAKLKDWNPSHFLDVGEIALGMALTYDWLYSDLSSEYRSKIESAILKKAIEPGLTAYKRKDSWTTKYSNWTQVVNGGLVVSALALRDIHPKQCDQTLSNARSVMPKAMKYIYAPEGFYEEGTSYWQYGTTFNLIMLDALRTAAGTDWNLKSTPGFNVTGEFQMYCVSPTYAYFDYADSFEEGRMAPGLLMLAKLFNKPAYSTFAATWLNDIFATSQAKAGSPSFALTGTLDSRKVCRFLPFAAIWYTNKTAASGAIPSSKVFHSDGIAVLRNGWNDANGTYIGIKGGKNGVSHSHLDLGSFVLDQNGVRWAVDLGREVYNLSGMSDYSSKGKRWTYYRLGTEGHNTLMINGANQSTSGNARISASSLKPAFSCVTLDLSSAYEGKAGKVKRTFQLIDGQHIVIHDRLEGLKKGDKVYWSMLTRAGIELQGSTASLKQKGKHLYAYILRPDGAKFESMQAKPWNKSEKQNHGVYNLRVSLSVQSSGSQVSVLLTPRQANPAEWMRYTQCPPAPSDVGGNRNAPELHN